MDKLLFPITDDDRRFMKMACDLAVENIDGGGGPSGAVIVKDGVVLAAAGNSVTLDNDPTAHAEVNAIRKACALTRNFKLDGCVIYCSCEPCPMCLAALYWAGVSRIYYANTSADADKVNLRNAFIYNEIDLAPIRRSIPCIHIESPGADDCFVKWASREDIIEY